ncbi:MAG: hypothetical protein SFW35_00030 [Chitinophagales bacterium]|nr:hypothetical protein [Chitinophagales bacterium]
MDASSFVALLKEPAKLHQTPSAELYELASKYPYNAAIHMLLAKKYQLTGDVDFESALHKAALLITDRNDLYQFIRLTHLEPSIPTKTQQEVIQEPHQQSIDDLINRNRRLVQQMMEQEQPTEKESEKEDAPLPEFHQETIPEVPTLIINEPEAETTPMPIPKALDIKTDKLSFTDWLHKLQDGSVQDANELEGNIAGASYEAIIMKASQEIVTPPPTHSPAPTLEETPVEDKVEELARNSVRSHDDTITETLAKILEIQKKYSKALDAYEKLAERYPDKKIQYQAAIDRLKAKMG